MPSTENTTPEQTQQRALKKGRSAVAKKAKQLEKLEVVYLSPDQLTPNEYNPNRQADGEFELLLHSMREDGFTQPIVAQRDGLVIVDGEHRWRAAHVLGLKEVPAVLVDMTPEQMRVATLRHNRARGTEDIELTAGVLRDLEKLGALDWAADQLMLTDLDIQRLLSDISAPESNAAAKHSQSWEPDSYDDQDREMMQAGEGARETDLSSGGKMVSAATAEAIEEARQRERKLAEAKSAEEREMLRRETSVFRLSLLFSGEEAEMVRRVLGDKPAARLLEILRAMPGELLQEK